MFESEIPVLLLPVGAGLVDVKHGKGFAGNQRIVFFRKAKKNFLLLSQIFNFNIHLINVPSNSSKLEKSLAITAAEESLTNTKQSRNA